LKQIHTVNLEFPGPTDDVGNRQMRPGMGKGRLLVVDDEPMLLRAYARFLSRVGFTVEPVSDSTAVPAVVNSGAFDAVICDIAMPEMDGIQVLQALRERDPDLPVILVTGCAALNTAVKAVEHGAMRYLIKPVEVEVLERAVDEAVRLRRVSRLKKQAFDLYGLAAQAASRRDEKEAKMTQALSLLWMAYQPIVRSSTRDVVAYEALVRSDDAEIRRPEQLFQLAEEVARLDDLGRVIRARVTADASQLPPELGVFVNLDARDLENPELYDSLAPLSGIARRVTLEITERASLTRVPDIRARVAALRKMGFRIAIDDLGAGYSSLSALAEFRPEVAKVDMSLVRGIDSEPTKRKLVSSIVGLCQELGIFVVAEGIETRDERNALVDLGCDLLQGYWFGRPQRKPPSIEPHAFD